MAVGGGAASAVFVDKDGTLVVDVPYNVDPGLIELSAGALEGLRALQAAGFLVVVVSNQSGIARGLFEEGALALVEKRLRELLAAGSVTLDGFYFCPHHPDGVRPDLRGSCSCRKPQSGMLLRAADDLGIDLASSWMIGDILDDIEAGRRGGCRTVLVDGGGETEWDLSGERVPHRVVGDLSEAAEHILASRGVKGSAR